MGVWRRVINYACYENKGFLPQKMRHGRRMKVPSEVDEHIEINEMPMRKEKSSAGAVVW